MEAKGQSQVSRSVLLCLVSWDRCFSLLLAVLQDSLPPGRGALWVPLPLPSQRWVVNLRQHLLLFDVASGFQLRCAAGALLTGSSLLPRMLTSEVKKLPGPAQWLHVATVQVL